MVAVLFGGEAKGGGDSTHGNCFSLCEGMRRGGERQEIWKERERERGDVSVRGGGGGGGDERLLPSFRWE